MKTATLIGYHGHKNLGDDIFRRILLKWFADHLNIKKCYITASKDSIEKELFEVEISAMESPVKRINRLLWLPIFYRAMKSDYLVFSAGSIFTIQPFFLIYITLLILKTIRRNSLKVFAVGVSIGPFKSEFDKYWCFKSLALMDDVLLRDKKSMQLLESSGLDLSYKLSYDLALCWGSFFPAPQVNSKPECGVLGVSLTSRGYGKCNDQSHSNICDSIYESIKHAVYEDKLAEVRIFAICSDLNDGDIELSNHMLDRLSHLPCKVDVIVYDGYNIEAYLSVMYGCSLMIALRMHAGIMAVGIPIPVFQISYAVKISEFYEHSNLSTVNMYKVSDVTVENVKEFLVDGLRGHGLSLSLDQAANLKKLESTVYNDLIDLK